MFSKQRASSAFLMLLPGKDSDFYSINLTQGKREELKEVEK